MSDPTSSSPVTDPYDLDRAGLERLLQELGEPAYRGRQVLSWLVRGVDDPAQMTDLPKDLRPRLAERFAPARPELLRHHTVDDGATHKFLLGFPDETAIETVLMLYPGEDGTSGRATVCVSTQAGCAMGCPFCATGQAGFKRQLTAGEVVRQVVVADAFLREHPSEGHPDHVTNVVYMGMGEPLANVDAVERSVRWLHDPDGFDLSARSITVSTVGLVPGIRRLADLGLPLTLAVSLHAPDDELRDVLVPPNRMHPLAAVMDAVRDYRDRTGRRVSYEYVLIADVNDAPEQARALADLVRGEAGGGPRSHVNLIPLNPTPGVPQWQEPAPERVRGFARVLREAGVSVTVRDTKGRDADAACGQLLATYRLGEGRRLPVAVGAADRVDELRRERQVNQ
ncbi:MAG: 23S rRNA (adenine(2503)-C(2))-methyltransferase RlmN [Actinobacteria bacterium]|nr:23S rRNA (adenine(2503)-C(2))-methyltransferase RlmN [Actinomycetota bacterium]